MAPTTTPTTAAAAHAPVAAPREVARTPRRNPWDPAKRAFDVAVSSLALVALSPLLLAVALLIKLDSPGPVLFRQRRLGRDMEEFTVLKFRTMRDGVSAKAHEAYIAQLANGNGNGKGSGLHKLTADPRVTRVGRVLRRLSVDELPQLINVLGGTMSLIGPRPALDYEPQHYAPHHFKRFQVRPGLSGLWQVSGRNRLGFLDMLDLDAEYAEIYGARTDMMILVRTPAAMFRDNA